MKWSLALVAVLSALAAPVAQATPEWAVWTFAGGTTATGTLSAGRTATLTGFIHGPTVEGGAYTGSPAVPGTAGGVNAPSITFFSADTGNVTNPGDLVMTLALANAGGIDANSSFTLEDLLDLATYRIELLDPGGNVLPLTGLQVTQFNLFYLGGSVGDYDVGFDPSTGNLVPIQVHDAGVGSTSRHSGMVRFGNLPTTTAEIRLYAAGASPFLRDGLRLSLSATPLPEPSTAVLLSAALAGLLGHRGRDRPR